MSDRSPRRHRDNRDRPRERYHKDEYQDRKRNRRDEDSERHSERNRYDRDRDRGKRHLEYDNHRSARGDDRDVRVKREKFSQDRDKRTDKETGKPRDNEEEVKDKEKPNFGVSGKLAEDTNTFNGVVVKYNQPEEAKVPKRKWRLYPFKNDEALPHIEIHKQSAYLFGRNRKVADVPIDHPSCSQQHAVIQFRLVEYTREDETIGKRVRPYVIDLESSNGTFLNNKQIEPKKYIELFEKDVLKFGFSTREYVLMYEEYQEGEDEKS